MVPETLTATRPTPTSRVWSGTKVIAEDLQGEDLADVIQLTHNAAAWWVLPRADGTAERELRRTGNSLELDELAIRDLLAEDHRAKFEDLGPSKFVLTNAVSIDRADVQLRAYPVSLVATERALVCLVDPSAKEGFHPAQVLTEKSGLLATGGVVHALQLVLGAVIDSYEAAVEWLEEGSDVLADALFDEKPLDKDQQIQAFRLRNALTQLRRLTDPMRTVMDNIVENEPKEGPAARKWAMLAQHHHRVANAADALREALASSFDTSLALADLRMNKIMKQLTGWAAILAVPTLVTGFVGMNVNFPLDGTSTGFWVYMAIMLAAVAVLYVIFRRKDWI